MLPTKAPIRRPLLLALCVALLPACKDGGSGGTAASPASGAAPASAALAPAADEAVAFTRATRALALLPAETLAVGVTADPGDLLRRLGRDAVVKAIPAEYARAATEVRTHTGADLLDPDRWVDIGVDPHAPAGAFFLGARDTGGFFFSYSDEAKLVAMMQKVGGDRVEIRTVGTAKLVGPRAATRSSSCATASASSSRAAAPGSRRGPTRSPRWRPRPPWPRTRPSSSASGALKFGRDFAGFLATQRLGDFALDVMSRQEGSAVLDRFIASARERGDQEAVDEFTRRKERGSGRAGERIAAGAIKAMIIGGMGPLVVGGRVEDDVVRVGIDMGLGEGALPRRVLQPGAGASPLAALAGPDFLFMVGARANVDGIIGLIRSIALAVGEADDLERERQAFRELFGVDFEADMVRALSGDAGVAVFEQDPTATDQRRLGMVAHGGVAHVAAMGKSLQALAAFPEAREMFTTVPGGFRLTPTTGTPSSCAPARRSTSPPISRPWSARAPTASPPAWRRC
ncbi:MAG: hypothetical protein R3F43_18630 [bacterium]